ncbi:MAG: serine hydrolase domain-containing protein [Gemmatimonadota bacterium]
MTLRGSLLSMFLLAAPLTAQTVDTTAVNRLFARYATDSTPGCAIGIARGGDLLFAHGYGLADLERNVPLTAGSVIEAGSVSKQFTAAAVLLLASRGLLSLDDNILHYFPELPDFGTPITIRNLMQHTSGLRDWGAMAELEGWPRGTRTATQGDVLTILSRQRRLNHAPGAAFSYTNSGYNLLVMLVERVTGQSFPAFTSREFFVPLGMTHTQWRDDYARIVHDRAEAYSRDGSNWKLDMPFENAYGNGGLLTTVGDLLRWTQAIADHRIGNPDVSEAMQTPGTLTNGKPIAYGGGLFMTSFRGVREISHNGATAGYRSFLAQYPESRYRVAVLCNAGSANPVALGHDAIGTLITFAPPPAPAATTPAPAPSHAVTPSHRALQAITGTWISDEAAARWLITLRSDTLRVTRRPGDEFALRPTGTDQFAGAGTTIRVTRNKRGAVSQLFVTISSAVDVAFRRAGMK